jgi:acyl-CoA dehydrogenase
VFKNTPIGAYQAIAHPLAEAKIHLEAVKLMTYRAAWAFDQGQNPAEVGTYANMAKFLGADLAIKAVDAAIETHGGIGFVEETGLITLWNGARLFKTAPVSREMLLNYVSEWNLGLPKSY